MAIDITPTTILAPFEAEHQAVDLTRNNKGSAWDRIGNNELIDSDQWRYNYNPLTGIFEGRTIMGQWTNEIQDPRDMTTGNWNNLNNPTITRDQVGIDGELNTACKIIDDAGLLELTEQSTTISNDSSSHTSAIYIKKNSGDENNGFPIFRLELVGGSTNVKRAVSLDTRDGSSGAVGSDTDGSHSVSDEGDWWRVSITLSNNSSGNTTARVRIYPAGTTSNGGTFNDGATGQVTVDAVGVFLNRSSPPPTPVYGETAGQSYTQDPDIATVTDLDAINFNPQEGTFVFEFIVDQEGIASLNNGGFGDSDPNETWSMLYKNEGKSNFTAFDGNGAINYPSLDTDRNIYAFAYDESNAQTVGNGVLGESDSWANPNWNGFQFGKRLNNGVQGAIQFISCKYYPRRLSNEDLIQETTI